MIALAFLTALTAHQPAAAETIIIAPGGERPAACAGQDLTRPCFYAPGPYEQPTLGPYDKGLAPGPYFDPGRVPPPPEPRRAC
jgi:hypothetical protein